MKGLKIEGIVVLIIALIFLAFGWGLHHENSKYEYHTYLKDGRVLITDTNPIVNCKSVVVYLGNETIPVVNIKKVERVKR